MKISLFPRQDIFFDFFEQAAENAAEAARLLHGMLCDYDYGRMPEAVKAIKGIEHKGDEITHEALELLNKTFVTPIDREDIYRLVGSIDNIADLVDVTAKCFAMFEIKASTPAACQIAGVLVKSAEEVALAVSGLRNFKKPRRILDRCVAINTHENEADDILHRALHDLFANESDAVEIIKWKQVYEKLETATDKCEDAANVIEAIVLKNA